MKPVTGVSALWSRFAGLVTARHGWAIALAVVAIGVAAMVGVGGNESASTAPDSLPHNAESARVKALASDFPGADQAPVFLVATRHDGASLTAADLAAVGAAQQRMLADPLAPTNGGSPVIPSQDGKAALAAVNISSKVSGFDLTHQVGALRKSAAAGLPTDLAVNVTGGPAFGADIANAFSGANVTLLVVTATVVALLLIITYRSPVLWLIPLIVIALADRVASSAGTALSGATGLAFDGSTAGITSVLVFGAGTNYALLLISRYRDELHSMPDHRAALRIAVERSGPAILASNATVVLSLLTLLLGVLPNTRSLGACSAVGLVIALVFVLTVLPPLLALFGRRVFWPYIPQPDGKFATEGGVWHRIAAWVVAHPVRVMSTTLALLVICACGLIGTSIGLSQTQQFRVAADSVDGFDALSQHYSKGQSDPTTVIAVTPAADAVKAAISATPGVTSVTPDGQSATGLSRFSVVLDAAPSSPEAFGAIKRIRREVGAIPNSGALVGGSDAQALDTANAAQRDRFVIIPSILAVVLVVLSLLTRAVLAPLLLEVCTVISTIAAIGLGSWLSRAVFGYPALDETTPLFAFLFLVALGVDYTIFLISRVIEETRGHGAREGIVRAVSATGAVITSAGIVLAAVFAVLGVLPLITLTQLGIIVGLGIMLDTFVVRTLLIPSLFTLVGKYIWWPRHLGQHGPDSVQG